MMIPVAPGKGKKKKQKSSIFFGFGFFFLLPRYKNRCALFALVVLGVSIACNGVSTKKRE